MREARQDNLVQEPGGVLPDADSTSRSIPGHPYPVRDSLRADLLKVGHHGSVTSSSWEFIHAVRPRWAIISVGKGNTFGHPRHETLQRLEEAGAATYRTDLHGAVSFYLDGRTVIPQLACLR